MSTPLEKLAPADQRKVAVYVPYCQGNRRNALPFALSLYEQGSLEGVRQIEGGKDVPFIASWTTTSLPSDLTRCRLQFDGNAELSYEVNLPNFEFVNFLIELLIQYKKNRIIDFPQGFYRKLLHMDE